MYEAVMPSEAKVSFDCFIKTAILHTIDCIYYFTTHSLTQKASELHKAGAFGNFYFRTQVM
jgi:hypothetical protein